MIADASFARRRLLEVGAAVATGALHPLFVELLHAKAAFIASALLGWGIYVARRVRRDRSVLQVWGFRAENLGPALIVTSAVGLLGTVGLAAIAASQGTLRFHWHMLVLLLAYPLWGLVQQFLVQALVVGNLTRGPRRVVPPWAVTIVSAGLFGVVHLPDWKLAVGTALLGAAFTPIYLKWRNLWPLGLYHGWLGVFFYFWLLGRDPWRGVFG